MTQSKTETNTRSAMPPRLVVPSRLVVGVGKMEKFKTLRRAHYALIFISSLYVLSFFLPLLVNNKALWVHHEGRDYFPAFHDLYGMLFSPPHYEGSQFGQIKLKGKKHFGEPDYRLLKKRFSQKKEGSWVVMPFLPYSPFEHFLSALDADPPDLPSEKHIFGTDNRGRDVLARLVYGFRISLSFALLSTILSYGLAILIGGCLGFFGGRVDLYGQRFIEILSGVPYLYLIMVLVSFMKPSFWALCLILVFLGGWIPLTYYIRGEFYREKAKDYVAAAISMGASSPRVLFRHILPNALTPVITFAPFSVVGNIGFLVALDFLGFGLPPPTPSWGELLNQGVSDIRYWWLVLFPLLALFFTLMAISFIGEGIRKAFSPT